MSARGTLKGTLPRADNRWRSAEGAREIGLISVLKKMYSSLKQKPEKGPWRAKPKVLFKKKKKKRFCKA